MKITVGELKRQIGRFPDHYEVMFGCRELEFNNMEPNGKDSAIINFIFNIYREKSGEWHVDELLP